MQITLVKTVRIQQAKIRITFDYVTNAARKGTSPEVAPLYAIAKKVIVFIRLVWLTLSRKNSSSDYRVSSLPQHRFVTSSISIFLTAGHISRNCPDRPTLQCFVCKEEGHIGRDCPQNGGIECYKCGQKGKFQIKSSITLLNSQATCQDSVHY